MESASLAALLASRVWQTPIGDDHARYYIASERPLVLIHTPYLDGYRVLPATLRALRLADIRAEQSIADLVRSDRRAM